MRWRWQYCGMSARRQLSIHICPQRDQHARADRVNVRLYPLPIHSASASNNLVRPVEVNGMDTVGML